MPVVDPYTSAQSFIDNLNDMAAKNRYYGVQGNNAMYRAMIDRQDAVTLAQQKQAQDQTNFDQQLYRDEAGRQFTHNENYLRSTYGSGGVDKSRFGPGPATSVASGPPPYQSPLSGPPQVTPASSQGQGQPSGGGGGGGITADQAFQYYINKGVNAEQAAGIVGNLDAESGFDPAVWSGQRRGDAGTAGYGGQWRNERLANLENYARKRGHQSPTVEDQLDFYLAEGYGHMDVGANRAMALSLSAKTPEEAADIIMTNYERPGDRSSLSRRQAAARAVYDRNGGAKATKPLNEEELKGWIWDDKGMRRDPNAAGGQRRYPVEQPGPGQMPSSPQAPSSPSPEVAATQDATGQPIAVGPGPGGEWTNEALNAQGISDEELAGIPPEKKVVGHTMLSEKQLEMAQNNYPQLYESFYPIGKKTQYGPTEYLILANKTVGTPLEPGQESAPGQTQAPNPQVHTDIHTADNGMRVPVWDNQPIQVE